MITYDICVDYDTLCRIEESLEKIAYDLNISAERMNAAIITSADFLAGNQYEKAKKISTACIDLTNKTGENLRGANKYIEELKSLMDEYGNCRYEGVGR